MQASLRRKTCCASTQTTMEEAPNTIPNIGLNVTSIQALHKVGQLDSIDIYNYVLFGQQAKAPVVLKTEVVSPSRSAGVRMGAHLSSLSYFAFTVLFTLFQIVELPSLPSYI